MDKQDEITVITDHKPRLILDASELTNAEKMEFDYLPWENIDNGEESASFIRYRGVTYDLGDFQYEGGLMKGSAHPFNGWDGFISDTFFSGVLVRYCRDDDDRVVMGRFYS